MISVLQFDIGNPGVGTCRRSYVAVQSFSRRSQLALFPHWMPLLSPLLFVLTLKDYQTSVFSTSYSFPQWRFL